MAIKSAEKSVSSVIRYSYTMTTTNQKRACKIGCRSDWMLVLVEGIVFNLDYRKKIPLVLF